MISDSQTRYGSLASPRRARQGSTRAWRSYQARSAEESACLPTCTDCPLPPCEGGLGRGVFSLVKACGLPPSRRPSGIDLPLKGGGEEREVAPFFFLRCLPTATVMAPTMA